MSESPPSRSWSWRTVGLVALILAIALAFWFGRSSVNMDADIAAGLIGAADPRIAWGVAGLVFLVGAFFGVPQFMLIMGAVIAFGPMEGAVVSWLGTMVSHVVQFWIGQFMGGERLRERLRARGRKRALEWMDRLRRNGILSSALVRVVPTGPALFVNLAAGASELRFRDYLIGTAVGIVPKIAVIALFGKGVGEWLLGDGGRPALVALVAALLLAALIWWLRRRHLKTRQVSVEPVKKPDDSEANP